MTEIINLRIRRKQATRAAARQVADNTAAQHGRSKSERTLTQARNTKAMRDLDGHQRDPDAAVNPPDAPDPA